MCVALVIQHAERMLRFILPPVACLALPYFSTLSHKRHGDCKTSLLGHQMCVFSLQLLSEIFLVLTITQRDSIINVLTSLCKVPVIVFGY